MNALACLLRKSVLFYAELTHVIVSDVVQGNIEIGDDYREWALGRAQLLYE